MVIHTFFLKAAILGAITAIGFGLAAVNNWKKSEIELIFEDIIVDNSGPATLLGIVRHANVSSLPMGWDTLLFDHATGEPFCFARSGGTVTELPDNLWGMYPVDVYMVGQDCSRANGRWVRMRSIITWEDRGRTLAATVVSDPFIAKLEAPTGGQP